MNDPKWWTDPSGTMHDWYKVSIFVGNHHLGHFEYDPGMHADLRWNRDSIAYFCPQCGDIWGRLLYEDQTKKSPVTWKTISVGCAKHFDRWNIPGSLMADHMDGLLPLLPEMALAREFHLHLAQLERELYGENQGSSAKGQAAAAA